MKALVWISAALISATAVTGCSKSSPASPSAGGGGSTGPVTINILGTVDHFSFSPNPADAGGKPVVFVNMTNSVHRVALNDNPATDTGDIAPGATSRTIDMPTSGTNYHCTLHSNMGGAVAAQGGGQAPPCEGVYCY